MMAAQEKPKITVNKLGEFLTATPKRQRRILEQIKYPQDNKFSAIAHGEAREAIKQYLINGFDENIISDCIESLTGKLGGTDHQKKMDSASVDLLNLVLKSENLDKDSFTYEAYTGNNPKFHIEGVEVSVYPDIVVKSSSRGKDHIGGLKIHLVKNDNLTGESGQYVAAILNRFAGGLVTDDETETSRPDHSISYDVFTDSFIDCPTSVVRRWENIAAGCMNIHDMWDSI